MRRYAICVFYLCHFFFAVHLNKRFPVLNLVSAVPFVTARALEMNVPQIPAQGFITAAYVVANLPLINRQEVLAGNAPETITVFQISFQKNFPAETIQFFYKPFPFRCHHYTRSYSDLLWLTVLYWCEQNRLIIRNRVSVYIRLALG
jgi:hypothetical protein